MGKRKKSKKKQAKVEEKAAQEQSSGPQKSKRLSTATKKKIKKIKAKDEILEDIRIKEPVRGYLIGNKIAIREDFQLAQPFFDRSSFGEIHGVKENRIELSLCEAMYLLERKKLKVFDGKKELTFEQFIKKANKTEPNFWTRYQVYRDIRTRGYIVKTALKFGADFRVYGRGLKPGKEHARWVLFATAESDKYTWRQFAAMNRVAHSTRKRLLVGIVDEEGECVYYEVKWKKP